MRREINKLAKNMSKRADYFELLCALNKNMRADILRDFESRSGEMAKGGEKEKTNKDKSTTAKIEDRERKESRRMPLGS